MAKANFERDPVTKKKSQLQLQPQIQDPDVVKSLRLTREAEHLRRSNKILARQIITLEDQLGDYADFEAQKRPAAIQIPKHLGKGRRSACALALLSDLHVETIVLPGPWKNIYTPEIAELRLARFFEGCGWQIGHARSTFDIDTLILWIGGDLITNHLHPENVETAAMGPAVTAVWVFDRIVNGLEMLLEDTDLERIQVVCSIGNHGRTTKEMRAATGWDHSWEAMIYDMLVRRFAEEPRIDFNYDRSAHQYAEVYGRKIHFHHGHEIKYGGGIGGIMIPVNKASAQWDMIERTDLHCYGHWHQYISAKGVIANGSLIGYDPYAMSIKATPEIPQQAFALLDSERWLAMSAPLWVHDPKGEAKIWGKVKSRYL